MRRRTRGHRRRFCRRAPFHVRRRRGRGVARYAVPSDLFFTIRSRGLRMVASPDRPMRRAIVDTYRCRCAGGWESRCARCKASCSSDVCWSSRDAAGAGDAVPGMDLTRGAESPIELLYPPVDHVRVAAPAPPRHPSLRGAHGEPSRRRSSSFPTRSASGWSTRSALPPALCPGRVRTEVSVWTPATCALAQSGSLRRRGTSGRRCWSIRT